MMCVYVLWCAGNWLVARDIERRRKEGRKRRVKGKERKTR